MLPMKVLVFTDYYLPGFKGGGPTRTLANMVARLGAEFQFSLVTRDRDLGDRVPYPDISTGQWRTVGQANVHYLSARHANVWAIRELIRATKHDVLYLNSFFSPMFTLVPLLLRRMRAIPDTPVIVAPRGELSAGAMSIKYMKKRVYMGLSRCLGLYHRVVWQASSAFEETDIRRWLGSSAVIVVAPDMRAAAKSKTLSHTRAIKVPGRLRVVFLSRVSRNKNLAGALQMLRDLRGHVDFSIYGPLEDQAYWRECERIIRTLPANVQVSYRGVAAHEQVAGILAEHDLFFLPTYGENFGHVILEALDAGCPVLISDQTPWRELQSTSAGWSLPLDQPRFFQQALQHCVDMDDQASRTYSASAHAYSQRCARNDDVVEQNRRLLVGSKRLSSGNHSRR